jgi:D-xylono/L-arabinono-1,4-lactonase
MEQLHIIADYGDLCGENPLWDARTGIFYWTDCVGLRFYRYDPTSGKHEVLKEGLEINGAALNQPGGFVICNNNGFWLWDGADKIQLIADRVNGSKCQMNDSIADPAGRFLAGSWFYNPAAEYELGKLLQVDTDGKVSILDEGIHLSNGLGFSPDCKILYLSDSTARIIYAYDYEQKTGNARNRRVFVKVPSNEGLPDGLTVDAEGFVWSAQWYGSCVVRYDPDGSPERRINTPAKQTSSLAFGGKDLTDIFITTAARSEPMPVMPCGYDPSSGYIGGRLYRINVGIQGKPEFRANISL